MQFSVNNDLGVNSSEQDILNILAYSDVFNYPLTKAEIYERGKLSHDELDNCLAKLIQAKLVYQINGFFTLQNDEQLIHFRLKRNQLAKKYMAKARFIAKIIANFPFIRGVFLSGSISKNCIDENSDIDFFIITVPKRLWVARLMCVAFRKTVLLSNSKYFCHNFLIDSDHLTIQNQSIFTAIEIRSLIPLVGFLYYDNILKRNYWTNNYFPNYPTYENNNIINKQSLLQKKLEAVLNNKLGDWLDDWFMHTCIKRRQQKLEPKFLQNPTYYVDFQKHIAKEHLNDHYPDVMKAYYQRIEQLSFSNSING